MTPRPRDIEAEIRFLAVEEGGRATPVSTGYRPQFYYDGHDWDAVHEYPDVEQVNPGDTVRAYLAFMSPRFHVAKVKRGLRFEIREGARKVAEGTVTSVLDLPHSAVREMQRNEPDE